MPRLMPAQSKRRPLREIEATTEREGDMADSDTPRQSATVVLPAEPSTLTPSAARALLRILVKAREEQVGAAGSRRVFRDASASWGLMSARTGIRLAADGKRLPHAVPRGL